ncbi:MAG: hypothetical protein ACT4OO_13670 [Nitrospiraceae bacterium]
MQLCGDRKLSEELEVLKMVTGRLAHAGIAYMVTGSITANYYAVPRMTCDIDIVVEMTGRDVDQIIGLFQEEFYIDRERVERAISEKAMFNIIHNVFVIKVDFVVRKAGEYRQIEFGRKRTVTVEGQEFFIVSPEDLILSKLEWAKDSRSPVQLGDVRNLLNSVDGLDRGTVPRDMSVKDTSPGIEERYRAMLLECTAIERLKMGCSMHATAQALGKRRSWKNNRTSHLAHYAERCSFDFMRRTSI